MVPGCTGTQGWRALRRRHVRRMTGADRQLVASPEGEASGWLRQLRDEPDMYIYIYIYIYEIRSEGGDILKSREGIDRTGVVESGT